jgi:hypothetical protein
VAAVHAANVASVATAAARWRPLAIIVTHDVYAFDEREFDALAKDVGARLLAIPTDLPIEQLRHRLLAALGAASDQN